jgi:hypothetical protein
MNRPEPIPFTPTDSERFLSIETRLHLLEEGMQNNTAITSQTSEAVNKNSALLLTISDLMQAMRGGMKVVGWLGTAFKWLSSMAVAALGLYAFFYAITHGGKPPG